MFGYRMAMMIVTGIKAPTSSCPLSHLKNVKNARNAKPVLIAALIVPKRIAGPSLALVVPFAVRNVPIVLFATSVKSLKIAKVNALLVLVVLPAVRAVLTGMANYIAMIPARLAAKKVTAITACLGVAMVPASTVRAAARNARLVLSAMPVMVVV